MKPLHTSYYMLLCLNNDEETWLVYMKYLGIDYGTKRIGIARSDTGGSIAFPLTTIAAGPKAVEEVAGLVIKEEAHKIILGESRNFKARPTK